MAIRIQFSACATIAATLLVTTPLAAFDNTAPPMTMKAGSTARLYGVFDCKNNIAPYASVMVDHGKVVSKTETINRCGNPKQPITVLYYTPDPGFRGQDEAKIFRGYEYTMRKINVR